MKEAFRATEAVVSELVALPNFQEVLPTGIAFVSAKDMVSIVLARTQLSVSVSKFVSDLFDRYIVQIRDFGLQLEARRIEYTTQLTFEKHLLCKICRAKHGIVKVALTKMRVLCHRLTQGVCCTRGEKDWEAASRNSWCLVQLPSPSIKQITSVYQQHFLALIASVPKKFLRGLIAEALAYRSAGKDVPVELQARAIAFDVRATANASALSPPSSFLHENTMASMETSERLARLEATLAGFQQGRTNQYK